MMQLVVVAGRQSRRHRLGALAVARANQACHVERTHPPARLVPQPRQERRKPPLEIPTPVRHAAGSANHRAKRSSEILYKLSICQRSARALRRRISADETDCDFPARIAQTRTTHLLWESLAGFKCQVRSTRLRTY